MLKRMELWDFESHKHTVVEDLSAGLNLICGESNAGKTSLVRALKLVAYNEFDPKSIRVGATKCQVLVETERGTVKVTRGPGNNLWEVTKKGKKTQYFDKVGKNVVPDAAEVLGLNVVTLGDVEVPVNIMDQLESHFMLSGVGGKDASGSMRAQIVDEISGLSGIEGLIKAVSLDNHRMGREVKENEDRMEEIRTRLHDEKVLGEESERLDRAGDLLKDADEAEKAVQGMSAMELELDSDLAEIGVRQADLDVLPDEAAAAACLKDGDEKLHWAGEAGNLNMEALEASKKVVELEGRMAGMPDLERAVRVVRRGDEVLSRALMVGVMDEDAMDAAGRVVNLEGQLGRLGDSERAGEALAKAGEVLERASEAGELEREHAGAESRLSGLEGEFAKMGDPGKAKELADKAMEMMDSIGFVGEMQRELRDAAEEVGIIEKQQKEYDEMYEVAVRERDEAVGAVKVCPLTLGPVSEECTRVAKEV